jgi:Lrp/AsnC family transcriptional regulator
MDHIDKKIIEELQKNSSIPVSELSKKIGITTTPCWNRIKKLEEDKIIISKTISLDNNKINLDTTVFLSISIQNHKEEWLKNFEKVVNKYDEAIWTIN